MLDIKSLIGFKKSMTLSKYFEIIHPRYSVLRLTPDTSIRNYDSESIARIICAMYSIPLERMQFEGFKFTYKLPCKTAFFIDISKQEVNFYIITPEEYENLIYEKCSSTWPKATIEKVESIKLFSDRALKYELSYRKNDALSLKVDRKSNEPLNSILNVLDIMDKDDRVGIYYNFIPADRVAWKNKHINAMEIIKENKPFDRQKYSPIYFIQIAIDKIVGLLIDLYKRVSDFIGGEGETLLDEIAVSKVGLNVFERLHDSTLRKGDKSVLESQVIILSDSSDKIRKKNNATAVAESYKPISEDNSFNYRPVKSKVYYTEYKIKGVATNMISTEEVTNFIQLPGRSLLLQYENIEKVNVLESPVPEELQKGVMCVGTVTCKGEEQKSYLSTDKEFKNLTLCLIGPTRAGKTTLISNLSKDSIANDECTILFDFCGNCDLSDDVSSVFSKDKVLNIDCSNFDTLQGLGYNEIMPKNDNPFEVYRCAKTQSSQINTLINSVNSDNSELKARMERYLEAAALAVFVSNGPIKDVFDVLQNHITRHNYIKLIPSEQLENLKEYVLALEELDEWSKPTRDNPKAEIIGTRISNVQGILNRVSKLKQNAYMELMLKKDCSNNLNLSEEIQKSQLICIRMPEVMFSTEQEKDVYCTYWLTKIWGALQFRKWNIPKADERIKVNIVFDELYQVPNCQEFLRSKLSQIAKFSCKPIISCHYLGQISLIRNELKAANSSYMLISGCDKDNFKELKEELEPYTLEDLLNLKRYYSLNLIKYENGWAKFISKLPGPIK